MWSLENLPEYAVARFGSEGRDPSAVGIHGLRYSHDGKLLAAKDRRQNIRILDVEQRKLLTVLPTETSYDFTFSPDDKFIVCGNRKESQVWSIETSELVRTIKQSGRLLATSGESDQLIVVGRGVVNRYPWPLPSKPATFKSMLQGHSILPRGVSDDGSMVVFYNGRNMELLNTSTGKQVLPVPEVIPKSAIFSPDSNLMAELNRDKTLNLFDLSNAQKYKYMLFEDSRFVTASFSHDSRFLYTSHYDETIIIWDLVTMQPVARISGHKNEVYALRAHPHRFLSLASGASGSVDRTVIFWDFQDLLFPLIGDLSEFDIDLAWYDMGSDDAKTSLEATNLLHRALQNEPALFDSLAQKLGQGQSQDNSRVQNLIDSLDARKYSVRERATFTLRSMVGQIRPLLERELRDGSQEAKWRIKKILKVDRSKPAILSVEGRRKHRAILALELCGNLEARRLLGKISNSIDDARICKLANAALKRLEGPVE